MVPRHFLQRDDIGLHPRDGVDRALQIVFVGPVDAVLNVEGHHLNVTGAWVSAPATSNSRDCGGQQIGAHEAQLRNSSARFYVRAPFMALNTAICESTTRLRSASSGWVHAALRRASEDDAVVARHHVDPEARAGHRQKRRRWCDSWTSACGTMTVSCPLSGINS